MRKPLTEIQKQKRREAQQRYQTSEAGKATSKRYWRSPKGIAKNEEPQRNEGRKEYFAKYLHSEVRYESLKKYNDSQKRKDALVRFNASETGKACRLRQSHARRGYGKIPIEVCKAVIHEEPNCRYCGLPSEETDHILPLIDNGTHDRENLQRLCENCHKAKTAKENSIRGRNNTRDKKGRFTQQQL